MIAPSLDCFDGSLSCTVTRDTKEGEQFEFTRIEGAQSDSAQLCAPAAPPCWHTTPLTPSSTEFSENTPWLIDANEGTALFSMPTPPPAGNGEDDWYKREEGGSFVDIGPATPPGGGSEYPQSSR